MDKLIYIIRHGDLDPKYDTLLLGHSDASLSSEGRANIAKLKQSLPKQEGIQIVCSPLKRARESAEILDLDVTFDDDLREFYFGDWELRTHHDAFDTFPELSSGLKSLPVEFRFPGGESIAEFRKRVERVREKLLSSSAERIMLVTHGGVISHLICTLLELDLSNYYRFRADRSSLSIVRIEGGEGHLDLLNYGGGVV